MDILLNDGWRLRGGEYRGEGMEEDEARAGGWIPAEVPGDVHSELLRNGDIEDPFYSFNAEKCRFVEERLWFYAKEFTVRELPGEGEKAELCFEGLDTFATVFLNGRELGRHSNMFTAAVFDVTRELRQGGNSLLVRFDSPLRATRDRDYSRMWYSYNRNRVWARKAQYGYRWDWGPRLVTAGIWRPVKLRVFETARLADVFACTVRVEEGTATVSVAVEADNFTGAPGLSAEVSLSADGETVRGSAEIQGGAARLTLTVPRARLWWTHDLGEPALYRLKTELRQGGRTVDTAESPFGIRTLRCIRAEENGDARFLFELNGVRLFARGANWVPADSFIGTVKAQTLRRWVETARRGNMNMLRVWGGGVYEDGAFYDACDRQGLLVWQDFMFTCSSYPDFDEDFLRSVDEELRFTIRRLRGHACLALWCGNNEIQWLHGQKLSELTDTRLYGEKLFRERMPALLAELDPTRLYWPSSPFGGNDPNSDDCGDKHNWQVWCGAVYPHKYGEPVSEDATPEGVSYRKFAQDKCRFASEFGIQAAPVLRTLKACIPKDQLFYNSFELRYRNKDKRPTRGRLTMEFVTGLPGSIEQYVDYSMLAQAVDLRFGIEHYRRRFPACAGSLVWQLNDCWPAISWSIVDYYFRPKAAYYAVKKAYAPLLLSFEDGPSDVVLWLTNNTREPFEDEMEVLLRDFFGNREYADRFRARVPAGASVPLKKYNKNHINVTYPYFEFLSARAVSNPALQTLFYFQEQRELNLPPCTLSIRTEKHAGGETLFVGADTLARFVCVESEDGDDVVLSDNYFDIAPGGECQIDAAYDTERLHPVFAVRALNGK